MSDEINSAPTAGEEALMAPPPKPLGYRVTVSGVLDNADIAEVTVALHVHGYSQGNFDALLLARQAADRGGARYVTPSGHINGGRESIAEAIKRNEKALRARWGESLLPRRRSQCPRQTDLWVHPRCSKNGFRKRLWAPIFHF